ncbi:MAG: ASKHA domain-containing protein, partial [Spirochaetaceae bacterium]|nr:ASKHA domain-containing protein [Spirochaetaceae bacterium]
MADVVFVSQAGGRERRVSVHAEEGASVLEAARLAGVDIETPCGGEGNCGKCGVTIAASGETVLACRAKARDGDVYLVPDYEAGNKSLRILSERLSFRREIAPFVTKEYRDGKTFVYGGGRLLGSEEGDSTDALYGLAVDIGTTTMVAELIDIRKAETLAAESALNPQARYAQDVIGRIHFAGKENGLVTLYGDFVGALNGLITALTRKAGIESRHIYEAVYSGNTTMLHLACNIDPSSMGPYPYTPQITGGLHVTDEAVNISPFAPIYLPPVISAWVGADITSGILATELERKSGVTLFVDIGTNGEMVLAKDGRLAATSTAAGPAFEGMNIACGMRASSGAVEAFSIGEDGEVSFRLIGEDGSTLCVELGVSGPTQSAALSRNSRCLAPAGLASGICGSGLIDIAGELVRTGVINRRGRLAAPKDGAGAEKLAARVRLEDEKPAFFITDKVYIGQKDVRQIQLAKSAIRCGIELLLARFGNNAADV